MRDYSLRFFSIAILLPVAILVVLTFLPAKSKLFVLSNLPIVVFVFLLVAVVLPLIAIPPAVRERARLPRVSLKILAVPLGGAAASVMWLFQPHGSFYLMNSLLTLEISAICLPFALFGTGRGKRLLGSAIYLLVVFLIFTVLYLVWGIDIPGGAKVYPRRPVAASDVFVLTLLGALIAVIYKRYRLASKNIQR